MDKGMCTNIYDAKILQKYTLEKTKKQGPSPLLLYLKVTEAFQHGANLMVPVKSKMH